MSITHVTQFHAAPDRESELATLLEEGRNRMRASAGCESFDLLRDESDTQAFIFIQRWISPEAHDKAFVEHIVQTGHPDKVLAALGEPLAQRTFLSLP